jgi:glutamate synthase (ferredoxin)
MSKMGISLLACYQGGQIFEIIGLSDEVVDVAFRGSVSRVGGMDFSDIEKEVKVFQDLGFNEELKKLINQGFFRAKVGGEYHFNSSDSVKFLHKAIYDKDYDHYKLYEDHLSKRPPTSLRDLVEFSSKREPIPVDEVESVADICKRFVTGGMSLGALSPEAHETLGIAMNRIGGLSNSGEGGEDKKRYNLINDVDSEGKSKEFNNLKGLYNGDSACSGIKQIASGRFGVTPEYLQSAKQLEIKVAQGAKPGEGGQLPGNKVSEYIAGLRYSKPGVTLISPPPHHDIYSIEDLAQLIYDLHEVNQRAKISVKLVAEIGIGTIASGVAKAQADIIQISGHEGGTAASPISSMKHAGGLWELGLVETHQALQENKLRDRVILRVDGGLRGGWEIVMAAILGADEFGFGSIAMIAEGCVMARVCHLNSCPVGIATQKEELRARFKGTP